MKLKIYCGHFLRQPIKYIRHTEVYQLNKCSRMIFISKVTSRALLQHQVKCLTMTCCKWMPTANSLSDYRFAVSPCVPTLPYASRSTLQAVSTRVWYSSAFRDYKLCQHSSDAISPRSRYVSLYCFLYFCITVLWNKTLSNFKRQHTYLMFRQSKILNYRSLSHL